MMRELKTKKGEGIVRNHQGGTIYHISNSVWNNTRYDYWHRTRKGN